MQLLIDRDYPYSEPVWIYRGSFRSKLFKAGWELCVHRADYGNTDYPPKNPTFTYYLISDGSIACGATDNGYGGSLDPSHWRIRRVQINEWNFKLILHGLQSLRTRLESIPPIRK